jgi:phosphatidate phosphatase APP1
MVITEINYPWIRPLTTNDETRGSAGIVKVEVRVSWLLGDRAWQQSTVWSVVSRILTTMLKSQSYTTNVKGLGFSYVTLLLNADNWF